ncbi:DUF1553 domain-containing protein [Singulisphaera acidiphila]|uniref:Cytochrome c domain-containing protein n=1 Tax=Singulisphaera acidiphila (strain ATCC BAA-1392 / DSM 18658 / VKM B-2454 / MOB10) TaxID=886293 RepID=L0DLR3_SINAD|nr:PSD1 and planctomycete cytochrome C domain-containing protein [Singulisphaera acidiphila]AGA29783.1 Protein of unknown function (DUF1553)/Protein of unknown function (DUF1549)/Planctomycete cytochrome C [Singulisphaera acidiphila DSM 18658]
MATLRNLFDLAVSAMRALFPWPRGTELIVGPVVLVAWILIGAFATAGEFPTRAIDFNREIRPILSNACFQCHGPDVNKRKGVNRPFRIDTEEGAFADLGGYTAVVRGKPDESELIARIVSDDSSEVMPPAKNGKKLSRKDIELLSEWVRQGAPYAKHWSLIPPSRPPIPEVVATSWPRGAIDRLLLARLEAEGIAPSPEADRGLLIRRLSFDLIGLPPTPEEVDIFQTDRRPDAYERLVERLLASPHFGERMAVGWLDLVRYADTVGYHSDVERSISPYRDYVIRAFNENLPFDRFTIEQLAGDLLPDPTVAQRVASGYNMLGLTTEEGGAQPKEYLARYAADRVRNVGSVWMGATLGCCECHDHKYDPYSARDFYAFAALFADLQQEGVGTPKPTLSLATPEQARETATLDARLIGLQEAVAASPRGPTEFAEELEELKLARSQLEQTIRKTIVAISGPPRLTRVLRRGDWMDETGEVVEPAVPHSLKPLDVPRARRASRLDLAHWLISPDHPQTSRVVVNRLWKRYFGTGLSDSLDDLGSQGEWPTHPELLEWLAVEFQQSGWDVKQMVRLMVTSSAYRQSSHPRENLAAIDPANRLYARQASFRLEAEAIRDNALAVSGLLVSAIGGESVRPYQPAGYWRFLNFPTRSYVPSAGAGQYRRGLYTHWQRTLLHPGLIALDAPSREACTASRPISNTPQAALTLLNDPSYVEAARVLAERVLTEGGTDDGTRLNWLWRLVLCRPPAGREQSIASALLEQHRGEYRADPSSASRLLGVGQKTVDSRHDRAELAAWTSVTRAILNLDETMTRD